MTDMAVGSIIHLNRAKKRRSGCKGERLVLKQQAMGAIKGGNCEQLQMYIKNGFDVNERVLVILTESKIHYALPLCWALECTGTNSTQIVSILLENGVDLRKRVEPVRYYEEEGGIISYKSNDTYLHVAVKNNKLECIQLLLDYGADVKAANISGESPFHCSLLYGYWESAEILIDHNGQSQYPCTSILDSVFVDLLENKKHELILKLLASGYDIRHDPSILRVISPRHLCKEFDDTCTKFFNLILTRIKSPDSLMQICRKTLRQIPGNKCSPKLFERLEISRFLKDFLSLKILWRNNKHIM